MSKLYESNYNPDVLSCLANLSNDEVFTSPELANKVLDLLPKEIWRDETAKFLDPCCKSGIFLREIAKRLIAGLEQKIPDLQERIDHIFQKQLYGIAITELTSLLSRRSLYCSKFPNCIYSVSQFKTIDGNIRFKKINHVWENGRCKYCGASKSEYDRDSDLETHAYEFIHTLRPQEIIKMKFDVIIGNPPYQLKTGGAQAQAIPLYNKFVLQAKKLNPRYITMIIPSRWFTGGFGLNDFRNEMLNDNRLRVIHDFTDASECFPGVEIKGGVCYFLWDRDHRGDCQINTHEGGKIVSSMERPLLEKGHDVFIRYNEAVPILKKILAFKEPSFSSIMSSQRPFGLPTNFSDYHETKKEGDLTVYCNKKIGYISKNFPITKNAELINYYKLFTPKAVGSGGKDDYIKPILGAPGSLCTETYVCTGPFKTEEEAKNVMSYIDTKFFHFLLTLKKNTQDCLSGAFEFIPLQDFSKPWSDKELYKKYNVTQDEIEFIESMVRPEIGGNDNE